MNENKHLWIGFTKSLAVFAVIILHLCVSIINDFLILVFGEQDIFMKV